MNLENISIDRSIVTTISMPIALYIQLIEKAKNDGLSISEVVRRALFRELENEPEIIDIKNENG